MSLKSNNLEAGTAPSPFETIPQLDSGTLLRVLMLSTGELLRRAFMAVGTWLARSQQRHALRMLDDHLLKDIGITREQARIESTKPFWRI